MLAGIISSSDSASVDHVRVYKHYLTVLMAQGNFKVGLAWTVDMFLCLFVFLQCYHCKKGKGSPYSFTERRVLELVSVLGSQPAGDVSHKPGGRLPLLSARPAVTLATLKGAATSFAA